MVYKYAVFDWDGTLADTYPVISAAYDYTFAKMNLPAVPYDEIKRITSTLQNKDTLGYVFGERRGEAAGFFYEYIRKFHTERLAPQPEAKELLDFCKSSGIECYLITNKKTEFIREELAALDFGDYFKKVAAAGEYAEDKPHPVACRALFDNKVPPAEEIAVIGDGDADVKTAAALGGAVCILYDPQQKYKGAEPDYKIKRLSDAQKILEGKNAE